MILFTLYWFIRWFGSVLHFWILPAAGPWDMGFSIFVLIAMVVDLLAALGFDAVCGFGLFKDRTPK
jgi:hypothetical protein